MKRERIRIYPKVYRRDNDKYKTWNPERYPDRKILIQEKLDGSNVTFGLHDGEFKVYSRTQEITMDEEFGKTKVKEFLDKEAEIREIATKLGFETFLISGELLGQAKLGYNNTCSGKLEDSFYVFDIMYSFNKGKIPELVEMGRLSFMSYDLVAGRADELGLNVIPLIDSISLDTWEKEKDNIYGKYIQDGDVVRPSLIDEKVQREGVVVKVDGSGMRYKIVSTAFKEKRNIKGKAEDNMTIAEKILAIYATDGRIEKVLQKLQLEGMFDGDRTNKRNYQVMFGDGTKLLIEDIFEEEINDILEMLAKEIKRKAAGIIKDFVESDGFKCECCEKELKKSELHPETRVCPHCGLYALKRKVLMFDEEKQENYLYDQVTKERYSAVNGSKYDFEKDVDNE